ncbi:hypothetical protein B0H13DRAFT_1922934 [Mycena leptocephala]|nr:hypothetical protein B0H13DRAFT_1922934 [Mycena leptocephala]
MKIAGIYLIPPANSSLDILRSRRPDYIPRSGFVWPIVDTATPSDDLEKKAAGEEGAGTGTDSRSVSEAPESKPKVPQRLQNNLLLTNAMRATALHLQSKTLPATVSEFNAEIVAETPSAQGVRNSATSAPAPAAKPPTAQAQESPSRALPGAGKKKRKRMLASSCRNTD